MGSSLPSDYYAVLGVSSTATQQQIRNAYKKAALKTHPDRVPSESPERAERTPSRRREYDAARTYHGFGSGASTASTSMDDDEEIPDPSAGPGGFPWSSFGFSSKRRMQRKRRSFEEEQFGDVFEEMFEGGGGGAMGFIVANFPGMFAGAVAGNRLGAVRDAKGKSVYAVFQELPQSDKARLLSQLAAKVFSHAVGS
ncbi:hypothetical protein DID88_006387 [Monilinia fructigena]|uniref:J domain-containing protein n=1 Tax=Monilinia fructigena TaxID=38457 RepID=A0A395IDX6_9HELO|nr:hypothetical protein DID88_006387 [Monilinia fructigena]